MFCPNCGSILTPRKTGTKTGMGCSCGYTSKAESKITETKKEAKEHRSTEIGEKTDASKPITDAECPKCRNPKAYYWTRQTRAADEGETKFHQCTACRHTWREYG